MLTIDVASACDVCSNAYGPTLLPYSIPCGALSNPQKTPVLIPTPGL